MNGCKHIKERIDEADRPEVLTFEVTEHIGHCNDCEAFGIERAALRKLVAGGTRVTTPINFDVMLNSRLAEVKARRTSWWLGSPGYLRLGAATAGLAVMIFAAQSAGLFSGNDSRNPAPAQVSTAATPPPTEVAPQVPKRLLDIPHAPELAKDQGSASSPRPRRSAGLASRATESYMTGEDGGVVLVRGRNGDLDVQMPTVSVGAQPLLYVSAGQRSVRNVGTSF